MAVLARGHVLLEDVPGVGKTTTALALCRLMGMDFNRIQFTPDVVPSDVTGFTMYEKQKGRFIYRAGAVMCNMLLADEINRTSSKTQAALLEVMEEGKVTVDNETHPVPQPFVVIATELSLIHIYRSNGALFLLPQKAEERKECVFIRMKKCAGARCV